MTRILLNCRITYSVPNAVRDDCSLLGDASSLSHSGIQQLRENVQLSNLSCMVRLPNPVESLSADGTSIVVRRTA